MGTGSHFAFCYDEETEAQTGGGRCSGSLSQSAAPLDPKAGSPGSASVWLCALRWPPP